MHDPSASGSKPDLNQLFPDVDEITLLIIVVLLILISVLGASLVVYCLCHSSRREEEGE
jgi:hypothetical protein